MQLQYDEDLVESAVVFSASERSKNIEPLLNRRFHRERERLYSIADPDERNAAFFQLHLSWFIRNYQAILNARTHVRSYRSVQENLASARGEVSFGRMNVHQFFRGFILSFLLAGLVTASTAQAARTPVLRYKFVEGETNVYNVQIETRGETGRDTLSGNIFVVAKSVSSNVFRLTLRGNLMPRREPGSMPFYGPSRMPMNISLHDGNEIQIDERGRVLRMGNDTPLPIPLGQLMRALFEVLPESGSRWEISDDTFVLDDPQNTGPVDAYLGSRYGVPYFGPNQGPALLAVKRRVNYQVKETSGGLVNIRKQIQLESRMRTGEEPRAAALGEGVLIFDTGKGLFRQIDIECNSSGNTENVSRKNSTALHVRLLEGAELEKALNPPPPAPPVSRNLTGEEFEILLADLKSDDSSTRRNAVTKLSGSKVETISAEALEVIVSLLADTDSWIRQSVANFISSNGTKDSVPYLIKLLKDSDYSVRQNAVKGLARIKDARAAGPLTEVVARGQSDVQEAVNALAKLGPDAEDAVLDLLKEKHLETRRRACTILAQIGTEKSIEPLKNMILDSEQSLTQAASEAVRAIQIRL